MKNLNISVTNKVAKYLQRDGAIVCGNSDYQITFTFDEEWDKYETKTARFIWNGQHWDQPIKSDNTCEVPIITDTLLVTVGVYAGDLSTTTPADIPCKRSILCGNTKLSEGSVSGLTEQAVQAAYRAEVAAAKAEAANPEAQRIDLENYITSEVNGATAELAKKTQLKPEVAESVEWLKEYGDETKLYVLNDPTDPTNGHIYSFTRKVIKPYINQLKYATDIDGTWYNDKGFKEETYLKEDGSTSGRAGIVTTGLIEIPDLATDYKGGHIILRFKNTKLDGTAATRLCYYREDKTCLTQHYATQWAEGEQTTANQNTYTLGADGYIEYLDISDMCYYFKMSSSYGVPAKYIRICGAGINDTTIITVNEEIAGTDTVVYDWADTGHAFVPADYEADILELKEATQKNAEGIDELNITAKELEMKIGEVGSGGSSIPDGVKNAVSALVEKAMSREDNRVLRFLISTDAHQDNTGEYSERVTAGNKELGQAYAEILNIIGVDFVASLGDIAWGAYANTTEEVKEQIKQFNRLVNPSIRGEQLLYCEGNHDDANYSLVDNDGDGATASTEKISPSEIFSLIYAKNKGVVFDADHYIDGYCYKDFEHLKVRVICLNTNQGEGEGGVMEGYQLKWFAETALNMSGKTDWSVITQAHHPADYPMPTLYIDAVSIIEAFIKGDNLDNYKTNDGTVININYSGKNCKYVGHFHGHAHAFSVVPMEKYNKGSYVNIGAKCICIPNACYYRENQYLKETDKPRLQRYSTSTTYAKVNEAGKRTEFNLVTVCLDKKIIYADCYGTGIDREISY